MRRRAFGVAETLLASVIIALVIMGLYSISAASARAAQTQSNRVTATALAEEGIDSVRFERERYWRGLAGSSTAGRSAAGFWSYLSSIAGVTPTAGTLTWNDMTSGWTGLSTVPGYERSLAIEKDAAALTDTLSYRDLTTDTPVLLDATTAAAASASLLKVTVTITWTAANGPDSYTLSTYLTDWLEGML